MFVFEFEWYCSLLLSVIYAGIFMILNEGQFFNREVLPCRASFPFRSGFGFCGIFIDLSLKLRPTSSSDWAKFDCS